MSLTRCFSLDFGSLLPSLFPSSPLLSSLLPVDLGAFYRSFADASSIYSAFAQAGHMESGLPTASLAV